MRFHTNIQYALMAMTEIAKEDKDQPVSLPYLANKLDLSLSYLEQIFMQLRNYGLVESRRGINGGYVLKKHKDSLTVYDIVSAFENSDKMVSCKWVEFAKEHAAARCINHNLWISVDQKMDEVFCQLTLADVINNQGNNSIDFRQSLDRKSKRINS